MTIVSENPEVYRSEFLAHAFFQSLAQGPDRQAITAFAQLKPEAQMDALQKFAAPRFQEGYAKGVHDHDALLILQALVLLHANIELLRFLPEERACACLWWHAFVPTEQQQVYERRIKGMGFIMKAFPDSSDFGQLKDELARDISAYCAETKLFSPELAPRAADYLFQEVAQGDQFVASPEAQQIATGLLKHLKDKGLDKSYRASLQQLEATRRGRFELLRAWLQAYVREAAVPDGHDYVEEAAMLLFAADDKRVRGLSVSVKTQVKGLRGEHAVIGEGGVYALDYNHFMHKLGKYCAEVVPLYERFSALKKQLSEQCRHDMRLEEFKPRVLSSFVRNKLIDEVYLPLFGDNLAKQIGGVGENKRTDRQGMLLLISPPGYGKTTLMEYISNRLGLIFMKINGPAIGHDVTSLDPVQAPNTAAREEINKLNLALEMGDNIMLYVDDIQHCNPEFLQKFISLCDAQRKIEGVYKGRPRTYDLRGKRVCVVMAGNPYTESGQKFKIPDMLSNRADTYNLGDIIGDTAHFFRLSLIENALSSNGSLQKVAQRNYKDIYGFLQIAETDNREGVALDGNYGAEEVTEVVTVLKKLLIVRDILLKVNEEYIRSAGMSDDFRTEPAFKLQGSYRDMNKLAEKVIPIMNDNELLVLIKSHYQSESQTLTTGAESNLLKFKELCGLMSGEERVRWDEIKATFMKKQRLMGLDSGDKFSQAIVALNELVEAVRGNGGKVK